MSKSICGAGGGPKGADNAGRQRAAYEAGLFEGVDRVYGTSVNSINLGYLAQERISLRSFDKMQELWFRATNDDVFRSWLIPYLPALWKGGLNSIKPLERFLGGYFNMTRWLSSPVTAYAGAVNLRTGKMEYGSSKDPQFLQWILASCAHPIWFEPVSINGDWYTDGGVIDVTPVRQAVRDGATEIIAFVHSHTDEVDVWPEGSGPKPPGIIARTMREFDIAMNARLLDDLGNIEAINKGVLAGDETCEGKRYIKLTVFRPKAPLDVSMPNFNPMDSRRLYEAAYAETKEELCES